MTKYKSVGDIWDEIAVFEEHEIQSWQSKNPILTEARTCARMEAYVKLIDKLMGWVD